MSEWQLQTLDSAGIEFIDGDRGKNYPSQDDFLDIGHCLFLSTKNVRANGFDFGDCQFISAEKDELLRKGKLNRGDIVLTTRGTVGNTALYDETVQFEHVRINSGMVIIRMKPTNVDSSFFLYFLRQLDYTSFVSGSAQPQLPIRDLKQIEIALPPLPEQKAIASVLSSLDDKIDLLHRQNKTLEAMAETLFRQWFIEEAKEDWDEVQVKDFVALNKVSVSKSYPHTEIEYLDTGSLTEGVIGELQNYQLAEAPSRAKRLVQHNDILISTVRPNQCHYGIISEPQSNLVVSTGFCTITCERISPYFVYLLLTNKEMTEYLHSVAEGSTSTYPSLKPEDIGSVSFQLPPKELIQQFHDLAESYWQKIHKNHKQIQILEKLRDTLLSKLMSGEVRVQYQIEEVA
jgi:type I restriction enzyme S subunit